MTADRHDVIAAGRGRLRPGRAGGRLLPEEGIGWCRTDVPAAAMHFSRLPLLAYYLSVYKFARRFRGIQQNGCIYLTRIQRQICTPLL